MFRLTCVKTRYFDFERPDNKKALHIEPPKLRTLKAMEDLNKNPAATVDDLSAVVAKYLSKNREGQKISPDTVMDWMTIDQMSEFLQAFLGWAKNAHENDPN